MKKIGIVLLVMTIFGFTNPLTSSCSNKPDKISKNHCIYQNINRLLAENGLKLVSGKIKPINTRKIAQNFPEKILKLFSSKSKEKSTKHHKYLANQYKKNKNFKFFITTKDYKGYYSVTVKGLFTKQELWKLKKEYPKLRTLSSTNNNSTIISSPVTPSNIDIVSTPSSHNNQAKMISSNINSMCIELQKNYDKFSKSNVEPRITEKARKAYNECIKDQKSLRKLQ